MFFLIVPGSAAIAEDVAGATTPWLTGVWGNSRLSTWKELTAPRPVQRSGIPASGV